MAGLHDAYDIAKVVRAYNRLEGNKADGKDVQLLADYIAQDQQDSSFGYKVASILTALPSFWGELYATGGLYTLGKKATTETAEKAIKKLFTKSGQSLLKRRAAKLGIKVAGGIAGGTLQAPVAGITRITAKAIKNTMPEFKLTQDDLGKVAVMVNERGDSLLPAITKAFGEQWVETVSEHSGGLFSEMGDIARNTAIKHGVLKSVLKANPTKTVTDFSKALNRMGWNGVINEMLEERVAEVGHAALGLQDWRMPTPEQLAVEFVSFSIPGMAFNIIGKGRKGEGKGEPGKFVNPFEEKEAAKPKLKTVEYEGVTYTEPMPDFWKDEAEGLHIVKMQAEQHKALAEGFKEPKHIDRHKEKSFTEEIKEDFPELGQEDFAYIANQIAQNYEDAANSTRGQKSGTYASDAKAWRRFADTGEVPLVTTRGDYKGKPLAAFQAGVEKFKQGARDYIDFIATTEEGLSVSEQRELYERQGSLFDERAVPKDIVSYRDEAVAGARKAPTIGEGVTFAETTPLPLEDVFPVIKSVEEGRVKTATKKIKSPADVAHIAAEIGMEAQENIVSVIADANNNVISVYKHTIGLPDQTQVHLTSLAGQALNTPKAAKIWVVHNHPSGDLTFSGADRSLSGIVKNLFEGSHVSYEDMMIVTNKGEYAAVEGDTGHISEAPRTKEIPLVRRKFKAPPGDKLRSITGTDDAKAAVKAMLPKGGMLLLNTKNKVVGTVPMSGFDKLRGKKATEILQEAEKRNANNFIAYNPQRITVSSTSNLNKFSVASQLKILDVIDSDGSRAELGGLPLKRDLLLPEDRAFFSRRVDKKGKDKVRLKDEDFNADIEALDSGFKIHLKSKDPAPIITKGTLSKHDLQTAVRVGKVFGKRIVPFHNRRPDLINIHGAFLPSKPDIVYVEDNFNVAIRAVVGHELTHHLEAQHEDLYDYFLENAKDSIDPVQFDAYKAGMTEVAESEGGEAPTDAQVYIEVLGDFVGDQFTDKAFWNQLAYSNPSKFRQLINKITEFFDRVLARFKKEGLGASKHFKDIQKARNAALVSLSAFKKRADLGAKVKAGEGPIAFEERIAFSRKQPEAGGLAYGAELPKYAGSINLERIEGKYGAKKLILDVADQYKGQIDEARRGVITNETTRQLAEELGVTEKQLLRRRKGKAFNAEEVTAARDILNASAQSLKDLERRVVESNSNENLAAFRIALDKHAMIQAEVSAIATEAGRALQAHRIKSVQDARMAKNYQEMLDAIGGREMNEKILNYFAEVDKGNQWEVNKFVAEMSQATTSDMIFEAWVNFLLSGPPTQVVNITSNALTFLTKMPEVATAATIDMFRSVITQTSRQRYFGEVPHNIYGTWQGLKEGIRAALNTFITEIPSEAHSKFEYARQQAVPSKVLKRGVKKKTIKVGGKNIPIPLTGEIQIGGRQVRIPGRALMAMDEFFKAVNYGAEIHAGAYRQAVKEGKKGEARAKRIAELINDPTKEMKAHAKEEMLYRVFQKDLGPSGRAIQTWRSNTPFARYVVPFLRTPVNIAKYGLERTPLNYPRIIKNALQGKLKGGELSDELARATLGSIVGLLVFMLAREEKITGGGPKNKTDRAALYRTGWQPYSIKTNGRYVSYGRLEPLGMVIGLAADSAEIWDAMTREEEERLTVFLTMGLTSVSKNLTSKTFLRGLTDALNAATDPTRYGNRWIKSLSGTVVPTMSATVARAQDPYLRDAQTILDGIKARIPGQSETLPYRYDIWGEPVKRGLSGAAAMVSPIYLSEVKDDPVDMELVRTGARIGQPTDKVKGIKLTPKQYSKLMKRIGKRAKPVIEDYMKSDIYPQWDDEKKANKLEQKYRAVVESEKKRLYYEELRK